MKLKKLSTIVSLSLIMACGAAMAATNDQGHGTVTFKGAIIEAPCSIAADSVEQTVQLGQVSSAALKASGTSSPRSFDIKLEGCDVATKKTVNIAFGGIASGTNLALQGGTAAGASIVITDATGQPITVNAPVKTTPGIPLSAGITPLHFSAYLKGDGDDAAIKTGEFTSVSTFSLNYP